MHAVSCKRRRGGTNRGVTGQTMAQDRQLTSHICGQDAAALYPLQRPADSVYNTAVLVYTTWIIRFSPIISPRSSPLTIPLPGTTTTTTTTTLCLFMCFLSASMTGLVPAGSSLPSYTDPYSKFAFLLIRPQSGTPIIQRQRSLLQNNNNPIEPTHAEVS